MKKESSFIHRGKPDHQAYFEKKLSRFIVALGLFVVLLSGCVPLSAGTPVPRTLCGDGFSPDYGFTYDLLQPHWTVGGEGKVSQSTLRQVDNIFDRLDNQSIVQPMVLILPADQVGVRTNCAAHFLRYMKLGLPSGPHKDNGFVFLIVTEPDRIDVHYAVGLGLPALTAAELTSINRAAESTYESTGSLDQALLTLAEEFNNLARNDYGIETVPLHPTQASVTSSAAQQPVESTQQPVRPTQQPAEDPVEQPVGVPLSLAFCGQLCFWALLIWIMIWMFSQFAGRSTGYSRPYSGPWDDSRSSGNFPRFPSRGFPSGGSRRSSGPRMRGGSGSGRSGRTN